MISSKRRNLRLQRAQKRPVNSWLGAGDSSRCRPPAPSRQMATAAGGVGRGSRSQARPGDGAAPSPGSLARPPASLSPPPGTSPVKTGRKERRRGEIAICSYFTKRAVFSEHCCRGPAGGAAESGPGSQTQRGARTRTRTRTRGPGPGLAWPAAPR